MNMNVEAFLYTVLEKTGNTKHLKETVNKIGDYFDFKFVKHQ
jgi:hypothetical protein